MKRAKCVCVGVCVGVHCTKTERRRSIDTPARQIKEFCEESVPFVVVIIRFVSHLLVHLAAFLNKEIIVFSVFCWRLPHVDHLRIWWAMSCIFLYVVVCQKEQGRLCLGLGQAGLDSSVHQITPPKGLQVKARVTQMSEGRTTIWQKEMDVLVQFKQSGQCYTLKKPSDLCVKQL